MVKSFVFILLIISLKGEVKVGYSLPTYSYTASCNKSIVFLSMPVGSKNAILYRYNMATSDVDSGYIPLGNAPEEISFFGTNSLVCSDTIIYIYDKIAKKINYYNFMGKYLGQFLLKESPYTMSGENGYLLLLGQGYIVHISLNDKKITRKEVEYKDFSPSDMWIATSHNDTAIFFEARKMILLTFSLKNGKFLSLFHIKKARDLRAEVMRKERGRSIAFYPVSSYAGILTYKNYYILQRRDLKKEEKNVLVLVDRNSLKIKKVIRFPRSARLLKYEPDENMFYITNEGHELVKISPFDLGIK